MGTDILRSEAERCLAHMFEEFSHRAKGITIFPLTDVTACRSFSDSVSETITALRSSDSPLPPTALILAMIKLCHLIVDPPAEAFATPIKPSGVPRAFAYEVLDRLRAEVPPTFDFALDQVGRIVTEAGSLNNDHDIRKAFRSYRMRQNGALLGKDLDLMVRQVWRKRYPQHSALLQDAFVRKAA